MKLTVNLILEYNQKENMTFLCRQSWLMLSSVILERFMRFPPFSCVGYDTASFQF